MRAMQNTPPEFTRTHILLGDEGLQQLAGKHVFVAGLGGVGSYCVEALARAGIGRLTLLDHESSPSATSIASCLRCTPPSVSPRPS